ncbi:MAG TPA: hypothetical protein VE619_06875 [Nitrososphaeraceae archaeon]|nr:hypothetical protein [Nitrososphaeraceae archaeon]
MDFKSWFQKKMKQQLPSSSKEEEITKIRSKIDSVENESKEADIQPIEQQLSSSSSSTSKQTTSRSKSIISYDDNEKKDIYKDYILDVLHDLPEQWIGKEMKLRVIADREDSTWITRRILEDVERGLVSAQFMIKELNHLCDITIILKISDGLANFPAAVTAINPVFSFILTDIKSEAIFRRKRRIKNGSYY